MHVKLVIIGSGPAALTAAIYASRANLAPLLFEGVNAGGQLMTTTDIENFPGFPDGINGYELIMKMKEQAIRFGTVFQSCDISFVDFSQKPYKLATQSMELTTDAIIIATGATAKKLKFQGSEQFWNFGISACAVCDGACPIFRNKALVVIGGGDSAMEEATFLTKFASKVYIVNRSDKLRASKYMIDKAMKNDKIEILYSSVVIEAFGEKFLEGVNILKGTNVIKLECSGLFYAIGHQPQSGLFKDYLKMDDNGYLITMPNSTMTNIEGVFACGDVQDHKWRQAITAAGSGCMAALEAEKYLS